MIPGPAPQVQYRLRFPGEEPSEDRLQVPNVRAVVEEPFVDEVVVLREPAVAGLGARHPPRECAHPDRFISGARFVARGPEDVAGWGS